MEFKIFKPDPKPKVYGVISVDPAAHTGIMGGSLANEYRIVRGLTEHKNVLGLQNELSFYYHPAVIPKGDAKSGSGVFMVTKDGNFLFTTVRGTTKEVVDAIAFLVDRYGDYDILPILERPHPNNTHTVETCAYIAGALSLAFHSEPLIVPPLKYAFPRREFNRYLKRFGVIYPNATEHEVDAFLNYYNVMYYQEVGVKPEEETEAEEEAEASPHEVYVYHSDMLQCDVLPNALNIKNRTSDATVEMGEAIVMAAKRAIGSEELRKAFMQFRRKEKGAEWFSVI